MADMNDSCSILQATHSIYSVPEAAALWCRVSKERVQYELSHASSIGESTALGRATLRHSSIPCLEVRIRAMHMAIDEGKLPACYENGKKNTDHIAYERRHVYGQDLKEWANCLVPGERPVFLFDEIERTTHAAINADTFRALQAELGLCRAETERAKSRWDERNKEHEALLGERDALRAMVDDLSAKLKANENTEIIRLQRTLGALVLGLAKKPGSLSNNGIPNVSSIVEVAEVGMQNKNGKAPHGYGNTTFTNAINAALSRCQKEIEP